MAIESPDPHPESIEEWSGLLRRNWEIRAAAPERNFFVASHDRWQDPEEWRSVAERDLEFFLRGYPAEKLAISRVLEIGCGTGRLAAVLAPKVAHYVGCDISPGMVAEARRTCAGIANAEFHVSDAAGLPREVSRRRYDLCLSVAVLIHNPAPVIHSLVTQVRDLLWGGGGGIQIPIAGRSPRPGGHPCAA